MKYLLIYNIFNNSMWYAEYVMNHDFRLTDGIECRESWLWNNVLTFLALLKTSTHSHSEPMRIYLHTHTVPPFISYPYSYHLASESVCIFAQMICISLNGNEKYYYSLFMAIYLIELHSTLLFSPP